MAIPAFDEKEFKIVREIPGVFGLAPTPVFDFPVTAREGVKAMYARKPVWELTASFGAEVTMFCPRCLPDNTAKSSIFDGTTNPEVDFVTSGIDMFGRQWTYGATAGGSMTAPGHPLCVDANDIAAKLVWPDINSWDWEQDKDKNDAYLGTDNYNYCTWFTGYFERLITLMDFDNAIVALIDEDQQQAVKDFFERLSDLYVQIFDKLLQVYPQIDGFCIHDDWGAQKDTFFSPEVVNEMIVPYARKVTDFLHSKGKPVEVHSCGHNIKQVDNYIAAGYDSWCPQPMNEMDEIYQRWGDQILIGVMPDAFDPATATEEEQRASAKAFVDKYCHTPGKPALLNANAAFSGLLTIPFLEELYKDSRIAFAEWGE